MKMRSMSITVPQNMGEFVDENVKRDYGNTSEYFRDLVRQKMGVQIGADLEFLEEASAKAPAGPTEKQIDQVLKIQRKVRKELRENRS